MLCEWPEIAGSLLVGGAVVIAGRALVDVLVSFPIFDLVLNHHNTFCAVSSLF